MCDLISRGDCEKCPYVTCNYHPRFHLVLECLLHWWELHPEAAVEGR